MSTTPSPIYSLLPAVFRTADAAQGGPLQALFEVLESQYGLVKENVWQLYNDQFIETCAPWVIPYIGQLIGYSTVYTAALASPDSRAEVANTIGYRRRKGTLVAMEQITHDVSGRTTMAVEEFKRLVTTLSLRDVRPWSKATADLRTACALEDQWGPFNRLNRTIDVRNITPRVQPPPPAGTPPAPDPTPLEIALHGGGALQHSGDRGLDVAVAKLDDHQRAGVFAGQRRILLQLARRPGSALPKRARGACAVLVADHGARCSGADPQAAGVQRTPRTSIRALSN